MKTGSFSHCWRQCSTGGCARRYTLRLNNGQEIIAATKPRSDGHGWYRLQGRPRQGMKVNELRVREIEASELRRRRLTSGSLPQAA